MTFFPSFRAHSKEVNIAMSASTMRIFRRFCALYMEESACRRDSTIIPETWVIALPRNGKMAPSGDS